MGSGSATSAHLSNGARRGCAGKPSEVVRIPGSRAPTAKQLRERGGDIDEDASPSTPHPLRARSLAAADAVLTPRLQQLRATHDYIDQVGKEELGKVAAALTSSASTRSDAPEGPTPAAKSELDVKVETDRPNAEVTAGAADGAPGHGQEQRKAAGLPARAGRRRATTRTSTARSSSSARSAPARAKEREGAARLVRVEGRKVVLDGKAEEGEREARLHDPMDAPLAERRPQGEVRGRRRAGPPAVEIRPARARARSAASSSTPDTDRGRPRGQRRRAHPEGRAGHACT